MTDFNWARSLRFILGPAPRPPEARDDVYATIGDAADALHLIDIATTESDLERFESSAKYKEALALYLSLLRAHQLFRLRRRPTQREVDTARVESVRMRAAATEAAKTGRIIRYERAERDRALKNTAGRRRALEARPLSERLESELEALSGNIDRHVTATRNLIALEEKLDRPQASLLLAYERELADLRSLAQELADEKQQRTDVKLAVIAAEEATEQAAQERQRQEEAEREAEWDAFMVVLNTAALTPTKLDTIYSREAITSFLRLTPPEPPDDGSRRPQITESDPPRFLRRKSHRIDEFMAQFEPTKLPPCPLRELATQVAGGATTDIESYFQLIVSRDVLDLRSAHICPDIPADVIFDPETRVLGLNVELPDKSEFDFVRIGVLKSGNDSIRPMADAAQRRSYEFIQYAIVIRLVAACVAADFSHKLSAIALNGSVNHIDPATGKPRRDLIISLFVKDVDAIRTINLEMIDPKETFRALHGISGARIHELIPVRPILNLDRHDKRLRPSVDVMDGMDERTNLASMEWQDFEHLVRQLFKYEFTSDGADVHVTQSSRDKGVDAIAFDPDPIRGGKFVIQAKRYNDVVDVSAVRDLYGAVMNEGANRGILVTTSRFGRDSFDFAMDKPLTLISGPELLGLLEKHGFKFRIDLKKR